MYMKQIGNVDTIQLIKDYLESLKIAGKINDWELPYEHLLTRLSAALFFIDNVDDNNPSHLFEGILVSLEASLRKHDSHQLSEMLWELRFLPQFSDN